MASSDLALSIAQTGAPTGDKAVVLAVFVVIGTLGPGTPVALYIVLGERSRHLLDALKVWMGAHNAAIVAVLCLIGDAITGLSA